MQPERAIDGECAIYSERAKRQMRVLFQVETKPPLTRREMEEMLSRIFANVQPALYGVDEIVTVCIGTVVDESDKEAAACVPVLP